MGVSREESQARIAKMRAGVATLVFRDRRDFDGVGFFAYTEKHPPSYASSLFVRLAEEADVTTTFELRKVDLQREGYDPDARADPLFVRDEAAGSYVSLTRASPTKAGVPPFVADPANG